MNKLSHSEIMEIVVDASKPPLMEPTPESVGPMECPICYTFQPTMMLSHMTCMRLICASCIVPLLDDLDSKCPICQGTLREFKGYIAASLFTKPSPNDQYWIDKVKYQCQACHEQMEFEPAKSHHLQCPGDVRTQNVRPMHPRGLVPLTRKEVICNPVSYEKPLNNNRLAIFHVNGVQFLARMTNIDFTVQRIKETLAKVMKKSVSDIQIVKFMHKVLDDSDRFGDISTTDGATFLSCFTSEPEMRTKTVNLIFEEVGIEPLSDEQRAEQIETRRRRESRIVARSRRSSGPPPTLSRIRFTARSRPGEPSLTSILSHRRRTVHFEPTDSDNNNSDNNTTDNNTDNDIDTDNNNSDTNTDEPMSTNE